MTPPATELQRGPLQRQQQGRFQRLLPFVVLLLCLLGPPSPRETPAGPRGPQPGGPFWVDAVSIRLQPRQRLLPQPACSTSSSGSSVIAGIAREGSAAFLLPWGAPTRMRGPLRGVASPVWGRRRGAAETKGPQEKEGAPWDRLDFLLGLKGRFEETLGALSREFVSIGSLQLT